MNKIDRHIFVKLLTVTVFILGLLIFLFILIDFSENSDDFTDRGAPLMEIIFTYYLNYIPEMIRLVTPVAAFVACLLVTGQMTDRSEIIALKSAGVSLFRLFRPYLLFSLISVTSLLYLDGFVLPESNAKRFEFEGQYLNKKRQSTGRQVYRQESPNTIMRFYYIAQKGTYAYKTEVYQFSDTTLNALTEINKMNWNDSTQAWGISILERKEATDEGFEKSRTLRTDTTLSIRPRDLARSSFDVYQLTYPEILDYIASIRRSGIGGIELPLVQFYGKISYPLSIFISMLIGLSIASKKTRGGRGAQLGFGLILSFFYLAVLKISEPFGSSGLIEPLLAACIPHLLFLSVGIGLFWHYRQ